VLGGRPDFASDPSTFHEILCRESFRNNPVVGVTKGCQAQRALFYGGTLDNGKVALVKHLSHGVMLRELVAKMRFEEGDYVTCYGGLLGLAPSEETELDTHMRHIPSTDYVLEGLPFSNCFPQQLGAVCALGYTVPLRPRCDDPAWEQVITSTGIGYMANTVTKCPMRSRARANVTVCEVMLGRAIPGVPYSSVLVLQASAGGIDMEAPIISPYESWKLKRKFQFKCVDEDHYKWAGLPLYSVEDESESE
jgi:hypothetical protein